MKKEILYSALLHLLAISAVLFAAPFSIQKRGLDFEVIKVRAVSASEADQMITDATEPPAIPDAVYEEEILDIPIDDPTSVDKPAKIDKPKPKPKPDKPKPEKPPTETKKPPEGGKEIDTKNSGKGSPFGTATVDNTSFDYPYWFDLAFNKISYNWHNTIPIDGTVICVIKFEVIKSGKIISKGIESSSGFPSFDQTCLDAITRSEPFPPLPINFRDEIIAITLPFKNR